MALKVFCRIWKLHRYIVHGESTYILHLPVLPFTEYCEGYCLGKRLVTCTVGSLMPVSVDRIGLSWVCSSGKHSLIANCLHHLKTCMSWQASLNMVSSDMCTTRKKEQNPLHITSVARLLGPVGCRDSCKSGII